MNIDIDSNSGKITFTVGEVTININTESTPKNDYDVPKFPVKIVKTKEELFDDAMQDLYLDELRRPTTSTPKSNTNNILPPSDHKEFAEKAKEIKKFEEVNKNSVFSILTVPPTSGRNIDFSTIATIEDVEGLLIEIGQEITPKKYKTITIEEWNGMLDKIEKLSAEKTSTKTNCLTGICEVSNYSK